LYFIYVWHVYVSPKTYKWSGTFIIKDERYTFTFKFCYCLVTTNLSPNYSLSFRLSQFVPTYPPPDDSPHKRTTLCKGGSRLQILNPNCCLCKRNKAHVKLFSHWIEAPSYEDIRTGLHIFNPSTTYIEERSHLHASSSLVPISWYTLYIRLCGLQDLSGSFRKEKYPLYLPGIELGSLYHSFLN
jgi:hypothetical protein